MSSAAPAPVPPFPRVPAYAWSWLQRTRPVLAEASRRLVGTAPPAGFVDTLRARFDADPFVRDVVIGVVCDVAFNGRLPTHRPSGASWDRGLVWWAAAIAGKTPAEFEAGGSPRPEQPALFAPAHPTRPEPVVLRDPPAAARRWGTVSSERAALVAGLHELLAQADGGAVPAEAVRVLLDRLERD